MLLPPHVVITHSSCRNNHKSIAFRADAVIEGRYFLRVMTKLSLHAICVFLFLTRAACSRHAYSGMSSFSHTLRIPEKKYANLQVPQGLVLLNGESHRDYGWGLLSG